MIFCRCSIHAQLAYYIWNDGNGTSLTHIPEFCSGNVGLNLEPVSDETILDVLDVIGGPKDPHECVTAHPSKLPMCVSI